MDLGITGRVAIVGASSKGLGRACADALAAEGVRLVICARGPETLRKTADEIRAYTGSEVHVVHADLTIDADIKRLVAETEEVFGPPDIVVTNTSGPAPGGFFAHDEDDFTAAYERLLLYPLRIMKLVVPGMRERKWGRIVHITSLVVREPTAELMLSGIFRTGLLSMSKTLAQEVAADNVLVNAVAPGYFMTDRSRALLQGRADARGVDVETVIAEMASSMPMGRLLEPRELGSAVAFLCSEQASGISGAILGVDGASTHTLM